MVLLSIHISRGAMRSSRPFLLLRYTAIRIVLISLVLSMSVVPQLSLFLHFFLLFQSPEPMVFFLCFSITLDSVPPILVVLDLLLALVKVSCLLLLFLPELSLFLLALRYSRFADSDGSLLLLAGLLKNIRCKC